MAESFSWASGVGEEVCICGVGARTPLGFNAPASAAAVRAAISAVTAHPIFFDKADEPMGFACDAALDVDAALDSRFEAMLCSAAEEARGAARFDRPLQYFIAMPEPRPGLPPELARAVASRIANALDAELAAVRVIARGHAAGLMALQLAAQKISSGECSLAIAAGVDSYHEPGTLRWLDGEGRLLSAQNRNGFLPGEAAGACLLATRAAAYEYRLPVLARITAAATTLEPHSIHSAEVCVGAALSAALKDVIASLQLPEEVIAATYCDLNGERYRNEELMYTLLRVQKAFLDVHDYQHPADCWGDVGAASGPLFAMLAMAAGKGGYAKGPFNLLWAGSESGHRTAVLLKLGDI